MNISQSAACAAIALGLFCAPVQAKFITFQPPGSTGSAPTAIANNGIVIGFFNGAIGQQHGFIRSTDGTFTTFDVPGARSTIPLAINKYGTIAGCYSVANTTEGFLRTADGAITTFQAPHETYYTSPAFLGGTGWIAGSIERGRPSNYTGLGFLRSPTGHYTVFGDGGVGSDLTVSGANSSEVLVGTIGYQAFVRTSDGTITKFTVDGAQFTNANGINDSGLVIGFAEFSGSGEGFARAPDGTITTFVVPDANALYTNPAAINRGGTIVGTYQNKDMSEHGFIRSPDGTFAAIDVPGGTNTEVYRINDKGWATGNFQSADGTDVSFIWKP